MKRPLKVVCLLLLLAFILSVAWYFGFEKPKQRKKLENVLLLYGNVDTREVDLGFRVGGHINQMFVEEGDTVEKGQLLAKLDPVPFQDNLMQEEADKGVSSANLSVLLVGTRLEKIEQAKAAVAERQADLKNAEFLLAKNETAVSSGAISTQEYQDSLTGKSAAEARLKASKDVLLEAIHGPTKTEINSARAKVKASEAGIVQAKTQLSYTKLLSPAKGIVQTRVKEPGAVVLQGETVYNLALTEPKWVYAYLEEPDLGRVKPGLKVEVLTDVKAKRPFQGTVGYIGPIAEFTPKNVETENLRTSLVYPLRVVVHDPGNDLRQGMPVTVRIQLAKKSSGNGRT